MKKLVAFVCLIVGVLAAGYLSADSGNDFIDLCGVSIGLGMEQDAVLEQARHKCIATRDGPPRSPQAGVEIWKLFTKGRGSEEVGAVSFDGYEKVIVVTRNWFADAESIDMAESIYFAVSAFVAEGRNDCEISAEHFSRNGFTGKITRFTCGRKELVVSSGRGPQAYASSSVTENLR
jgi:hypothetical protein